INTGSISILALPTATMIFTEFRFFLFFAVVFGLYWTLQSHRWRKAWILLCSYAFYGAWDWRFLSLIIGSTLIDYIVGLNLASPGASQKARKSLLLLSLSVNLGALAFFKYANFFADSAVGFFGWLGLPANEVTLGIVLPVGISFYTFQTLSYSIDIYNGRLKPRESLLDLATFVAFFPQLVAGPIVRAADFLPQLETPRLLSQVNVKACLMLFMVGFFKKACVSDNLAPIVDRYFADPGSFDAVSSWIGVLSYTTQIYCDFSGYSDMAIACAGLLGYELCENFNFPYFASSITDFWRRWHISLSTWLKDYLYIPLGGNRGGQWFTYRNLMLTMVLGGLWHGAAWTFVVWGALHGGALIVHKEWSKIARRVPMLASPSLWLQLASVLLTFYWVCITWIFFRADSFASAVTVLRSFVLFSSPGVEQFSLQLLGVIFVLGCVHWLTSRRVWEQAIAPLPKQLFAVGYGFAAAIILTLVPVSYTAFIYFQF
ncbi:MAG: MBOAT family O-acyltransferase, partial [Cyanobacteria bacterium J06607_10]